LIDVDDFVEMLDARDSRVLTREHAGAVQVPRERTVQNVFDERGLFRNRSRR